METQQLRKRMGLLGCFLAPVLLLTACTSSSDTRGGGASSASPGRTGTAAQQAARQERKLTAEVRTALDATAAGRGSMVESGIERVADGIHSEPTVAAGAAYRLTVVYAGSGAAAIEFTPKGVAARKPVGRDRAMVLERFVGRKSLRLDVNGEPGATGMIAWRIDKV